MKKQLDIISGSSHIQFAKDIYNHLQETTSAYSDIDIRYIDINKVKFGNENILVSIKQNVREGDVFFIQSSCPPVSDNIIESFLIIDALKHSSAKRITMVSPYWPYVRSDKKDQPRISIAAKLMARLHETAGADRFLTMDLHAEQIQGFFNKPIDQLSAKNIFCKHISFRINSNPNNNYILVAPDVGEAKHLEGFGNELNLPMAIIDKRRNGNTDTIVVNTLIGDVKDKHVLMVDDEVASAGTLCQAAEFLKGRGALSIRAYITHGVLSGSAIQKLNDSCIDSLIITDTIPLEGKDKLIDCSKIFTLSVTELFAKAILNIHNGHGLSELF